MLPVARLPSISMSWLAAWFCAACLWQPASAAAPTAAMIPIAVLAFRIGVARRCVCLRSNQLVSGPFQTFVLAPALPFSGEIEMAVNRSRIRVRVCRRYGSGLIESQLTARDDEQALGIAPHRRAIGRR